ncbi:Pyruvate/Phosphoenolpyruvate kinase-like domain-containing protein [Aspergillus carlsbadensis]|nr:Pyruvate/Phosphoenolpyruvate kinase-like domain-containing protein [Aspergillus carlsbadensis]
MALYAFPNNLMTLAGQGKVCRTLKIKFITSLEIIYIARNAGFHALFIDLEHSPLSLETASHLCVTAMNAGLSPIARVPGQAEPGFYTPSKYPPRGKRSVTGMLPHMGYRSAPISDVSAVGNTQLSTVLVMIESPEAVASVDEIVAVEGVDVVLVGTNDLSIELGVAGDFDHPSFVESMQTLAVAVKRYGKILGVAGIYNRPDLLRGYIHELGARFVVGHVDLPMVAKAAGTTAEELVKGRSSSKSETA